MANKGKKRDADNLGDLLATLYIQQQSGMLSVESLQNGRWEEGELYILAGQPIYARQGKVSGQEALKRLLLWRSLRFSFSTDAPRPPANLPANIGIQPAPTRAPAVAPPRSVTGNLANGMQPPRELLIPRKIGVPQQALSLPLTHRQRLIYFLINGQRTIADLARTSGKTIPEVEEILRELQYYRLIEVLTYNSN
jgi:hypothetical protein